MGRSVTNLAGFQMPSHSLGAINLQQKLGEDNDFKIKTS